MRHIKTINELFIYPEEFKKDVSFIEEILTEFEDSNAILPPKISVDRNDLIIVEITIDSKYKDFKKIELLDRIIFKLKRRFKYIWFYYNQLIISRTPPENNEYLTKDIYSSMVDMVSSLCANIKKYTRQFHPEQFHFGPASNRIYFKYDTEEKELKIDDIIWDLLITRSHLSYEDLATGCQKIFSDKYKLDIKDVNHYNASNLLTDLIEVDN